MTSDLQTWNSSGFNFRTHHLTMHQNDWSPILSLKLLQGNLKVYELAPGVGQGCLFKQNRPAQNHGDKGISQPSSTDGYKV